MGSREEPGRISLHPYLDDSLNVTNIVTVLATYTVGEGATMRGEGGPGRVHLTKMGQDHVQGTFVACVRSCNSKFSNWCGPYQQLRGGFNAIYPAPAEE